MISFELSNVHKQKLILVKKVRLIDNIDEQYKEQVKLLNQQVYGTWNYIESAEEYIFCVFEKETRIACSSKINLLEIYWEIRRICLIRLVMSIIFRLIWLMSNKDFWWMFISIRASVAEAQPPQPLEASRCQAAPPNTSWRKGNSNAKHCWWGGIGLTGKERIKCWRKKRYWACLNSYWRLKHGLLLFMFCSLFYYCVSSGKFGSTVDETLKNSNFW